MPRTWRTETCYWHDCHNRATKKVTFKLPHILAGQTRKYCDPHEQFVTAPKSRRGVNA